MLTVFTIIESIQISKIDSICEVVESWCFLEDSVQVIVFSKNKEIKFLEKKYNLSVIDSFSNMKDIFSEVRKISKYSVICYVNANIHIDKIFYKKINLIKYDPYLGVASYGILKINNKKNNSSTLFKNNFLFTDILILKNIINSVNFPEFSASSEWWKSWLIFEIKNKKMPVIDISKSIIFSKNDLNYINFANDYLEENMMRDVQGALISAEHMNGYLYSFSVNNASYILLKKWLVPALLPRNIVHLVFTMKFMESKFSKLVNLIGSAWSFIRRQSGPA